VSTPAELEDSIKSAYPYPVAVAYHTLTEQESAAAAFGCLLDTFESFVHFLATVAVCAYLRSGLSNAECNRRLLEKFLKGAWSTGDLVALLRDVVRLDGACDWLPYPELSGYLFTAKGELTPSYRTLEAFVTLRNRAWGHVGGRDEAFYTSLLPENRDRLEAELARTSWLGSWELVRPITIDDGQVTRADLLMGVLRRKGRPYALTLDEADRPDRGGEIRAETSLLLAASDRRRYLPLFPLSLFPFHLRSQGVYFLQRADWQRPAGIPQLRRACYVAYESGLEAHEERAGDQAARSLEGYVRRLAASLVSPVDPAALHPEPEPETDGDYELAEVRHEQQFHLRTFAGREALLQDVAAWIDRTEEGGYLLLLGPPGQGKSALTAELARRESRRGGCLLHMVKSHRNPLKFLPSLISQAARLANTRFGPEAYRGDVDDLRNALLRALEAVKAKTGRAVVVLDALDELDSTGQRLAFLPEVLPPGGRIVLTCRPDIPLVRALRARLQRLDESELPPLSEADLPAVLARQPDLQAVQSVAGAVDWVGLFCRLGGNPLFLQRAFDRIVRMARQALAAGVPLQLDLDTLPATLEALFEDIYNEVAERQGMRYTTPEGRHKARLLQLLCLAREPLGFDQLAGLLAADGTPLPLEDCRDRIMEMSQYLLDVGGNRFKPWHLALADHVRDHVLGEAGCLRIEEVYCVWLRGPASGHYALRHRPGHLLAARRFDELADLLTSPTFLEAKAEAGLVFDLADDLAGAARGLPGDHPRRSLLRLLEEAIRRDIHFLANRPMTLFQCLWNSGWWYDCPQAAQHYEVPTEMSPDALPWNRPGPKLSALMETWRAAKEAESPGFAWLRLLRPPWPRLGCAQLRVLRGHGQVVRALAVSPDGRRLVSGANDCTVRIWDAASGRELACLEGHRGQVLALAFAPDGSQFASASQDGTVRVWDAEGSARLVLTCCKRDVRCVAFSPDGRLIAAGGRDKAVRLWDAGSGAEVACLRGHKGPIASVDFSPDGRLLVTGSFDHTIRLWYTTGSSELAIVGRHGHRIAGVAFARAGDILASVSNDDLVRLWDVTARAGRATLRAPGDELTSVALAPDGRLVAAGSVGGIVRVWHIASGGLRCFRGHIGPVHVVRFAPDGKHLLSAGDDGTIRIWDSYAEEDDLAPRPNEGGILSLAFNRNGKYIALGGLDGSVRIWTTDPLREEVVWAGHHRGAVLCLTFAPDRIRLASGSHDGTARVWDIAAYRDVVCLRGHLRSVASVCFSPDGTLIVTGSRDSSVRVWDVASATEVLRLLGHGQPLTGAVFSPDGRRIVSGSWDATVRVWDAATGVELARLASPDGVVHKVAYAVDSQRVFFQSKSRRNWIWDPEQGTCEEKMRDEGSLAGATGSLRSRWWVKKGEGELTVVETATWEPMAHLPITFRLVRSHPNDRTWGAVQGGRVILFTLEGPP
jgi:WD40 repeat protein